MLVLKVIVASRGQYRMTDKLVKGHIGTHEGVSRVSDRRSVVIKLDNNSNRKIRWSVIIMIYEINKQSQLLHWKDQHLATNSWSA